MRGQHRGYYDPADPEVETITPKVYEREHDVDLREYGSVWLNTNDGGQFEVPLDFVETPFGTRTYFLCPECNTRRHKLHRPPELPFFACLQCLRDVELLRYACNVRHKDPAWELFGKHGHQAKKALQKLLAEPRPRGGRRQRLVDCYAYHRQAAVAGRRLFAIANAAGLKEAFSELDEQTEQLLASHSE